MNNDTTQILLAIVLGIVICWFVFGRNCGSSDGFSVGGSCDNYLNEMSKIRKNQKCSQNFDIFEK